MKLFGNCLNFNDRDPIRFPGLGRRFGPLSESAKGQRVSPGAVCAGMGEESRREYPQATRSLDAKGLACPLPVLKAKVILNRLQPGETLLVEATDPHAPVDFGAYCARSGHELLHTETSTSGILKFYIRRAANSA